MKYILFVFCTLNTFNVFSQDTTYNKAYGLLPPTVEELMKVPFAASASGVPFGLKFIDSLDISSDMPPVGDQGLQGSCVAWTLAYGLKSFQEKIKKNWSYFQKDGKLDPCKVFSPTFVFNKIKNNRAVECTECKQGITYFEAFNDLRETGVVPLSKLPYLKEDSLGCLKPKEMKRKLLRDAKNYKIASYEGVFRNSMYETKFFINQKMPIVIGFFVDSSFSTDGSNASRSHKKYIWHPKTKQVGYHAVLCVGYNDSLKVIKLLNSWGDKWGNNGYFYMSYDDYLNRSIVMESYIVHDARNSKSIINPTRNEGIPGPIVSTPTIGDSLIIQNAGYSSWFKVGYYRVFNNYRIGLTYLSKSKNDKREAIVQFTDNVTNKVIQSLDIKEKEAKEFINNGQKLLFYFDRIDGAGNNPFKKAVFFNFKVTPDNSGAKYQTAIAEIERMKEILERNSMQIMPINSVVVTVTKSISEIYGFEEYLSEITTKLSSRPPNESIEGVGKEGNIISFFSASDFMKRVIKERPRIREDLYFYSLIYIGDDSASYKKNIFFSIESKLDTSGSIMESVHRDNFLVMEYNIDTKKITTKFHITPTNVQNNTDIRGVRDLEGKWIRILNTRGGACKDCSFDSIKLLLGAQRELHVFEPFNRKLNNLVEFYHLISKSEVSEK